MNAYQSRVAALIPEVTSSLMRCHVSPAAVDFLAPHRPGRRPGEARSEFLANRAMGDWAEGAVQLAINRPVGPDVAIKYGNADHIVAGDPHFADFYTAYQAELGKIGKRPDLLLVKRELAHQSWADDVSTFTENELNEVVKTSHAALEIRSSKYFALEYEQVRMAEGRQGARSCQSFTPKIEDLKLVKRWIDYSGVPHFYIQVFFDVVYLISFERILTLVAHSPHSFDVEYSSRNQEKPTIHIPVTFGTELGRFTEFPTFRAETRKTRLARLDAFVSPAGGRLEIDAANLQNSLAA